MPHTDMTPIPNSHFIGQGKYPWLISGRVPGDETNTVRLVLADTDELARETFRTNLVDEADMNEEEIAETTESYGSDVIYTLQLRLT